MVATNGRRSKVDKPRLVDPYHNTNIHQIGTKQNNQIAQTQKWHPSQSLLCPFSRSSVTQPTQITHAPFAPDHEVLSSVGIRTCRPRRALPGGSLGHAQIRVRRGTHLSNQQSTTLSIVVIAIHVNTNRREWRGCVPSLPERPHAQRRVSPVECRRWL